MIYIFGLKKRDFLSLLLFKELLDRRTGILFCEIAAVLKRYLYKWNVLSRLWRRYYKLQEQLEIFFNTVVDFVSNDDFKLALSLH